MHFCLILFRASPPSRAFFKREKKTKTGGFQGSRRLRFSPKTQKHMNHFYSYADGPLNDPAGGLRRGQNVRSNSAQMIDEKCCCALHIWFLFFFVFLFCFFLTDELEQSSVENHLERGEIIIELMHCQLTSRQIVRKEQRNPPTPSLLPPIRG